ncbi:MAG: hypothetical protein ACOYU7_03100 [Bacillota bacterium]
MPGRVLAAHTRIYESRAFFRGVSGQLQIRSPRSELTASMRRKLVSDLLSFFMAAAAAAAEAGTPLSGIVTDTSGPVVPGAIVALKTATGGNADGPKATEREPSDPQVCQPGPMEHGRNEVAPEIWTVIARSLRGSRQVLGGGTGRTWQAPSRPRTGSTGASCLWPARGVRTN